MPYHSPISDRNPEPNNRQLVIILGVFISFFLLLIITLFTLFHQLINFIPIELEQKLGSLITSQLNIENTDSVTQSKFNKLLDDLERQLPENSPAKRDYQLFYVEENTINALAIPGDQIIIYQGLLDKMDSENELVMVLSHEIGHFANRDHLRGLGNFLIMRLLFSFFFGGGGFIQGGANFQKTKKRRRKFSF